MDTKRLLLAVALSIGVLILWANLFAPPPQAPVPTEPASLEQSGGTPEQAPEQPPEPDANIEPDEPPLAAAGEETLRVNNGLFVVELTNRGGRARSWRLLEYTTGDGEPLELMPQFEESDLLPLGVDLDDSDLTAELNQALFEVSRERLDAGQEGATGEKITFRWSDGRGLQATKEFSFWKNEYLVDVFVNVVDRGRRRDARLVVGPGFGAQELGDGRSNYYYAGQAAWNLGGTVSRTKRGKLDNEGGLTGSLRWGGLEDQYFTALVLPGEGGAALRWSTRELTPLPIAGADPSEPPEPIAETLIAVSLGEQGGRLYVGPKRYKLLRELGTELDKSVWFSSVTWLAWIVRHIYLALLWIHDHVVANYGVAIVLATMVLRILLFPVNQYSMVSMKKTQLQMQRLQPKLKSIKNKYKKSKDAQARTKMNQETMELYKREGVNPAGGLSGCLPLLAQFPILIGFYNMLTVAVELRGAPFFGWIQDLSLQDPLYITPLLMGATMFTQQKMAMSKIKDPQQLQQQRFMLFMPFMFTIICVNMPSGLVLYWFVNNLLGMGQQWLVNRQTGRLESAAQKA